MNRLLVTTFLLLASFAGWSQKLTKQPEQCATMEMDSLLRARFPQLGTLGDFEKTLQEKVAQINRLRRSGRMQLAVISIPVVVHIVHNGEASGTGRNISEAQVRSQLETLNEDFRRKPGTRGFNDNPVGADIEIEFCAAALDPQGRPMAERGIDRVNGNRANWSRDDIEGVLKPGTYWDPNKYFNIWVVDFAPVDERLLGYAQFPSQSELAGIPDNGGAASTDGVVIRYQSFGNAEKGNFPVMQAPYNLGRTLTHEVGHWLGLRHIWGDGRCGDDFVADTPTQESESRGCQVGRVSCGGANMVQNYMDYSDDGCFNVFTQGQKDRMRAVMELSPRRVSLTSSNVCGTLVTSRPIPNFRSETRRVLLGGSVRFTDLSGNFPNRWVWTFEGGNPQSSTTQNPTVTYNTPGRFRVKLVVSNTAGTDSLVREQYIEVLNQGLCTDVTNFQGTPTVIRQPNGRGYVSGQSSRKVQALSEQFNNELGYTNLSTASFRFGLAKAAQGANTESIVTVMVWNGRGFQGGPGAVLGAKDIPLRVILADVAAGRPTTVSFDRNVPIFGLSFHVGILLPYAAGDTVALFTTRNGESTQATAWELDSNRVWERVTIRQGLNIAHAISANIGMKPSVQISASAQFINPGETVTLSARGASVFNWGASPTLSALLGPQVIATPRETTTYTVTGSGIDLCNTTASARVFVRAGTVTATPAAEYPLRVTPNPSDGQVEVSLSNTQRGTLNLGIRNLKGQEIIRETHQKTADEFRRGLDLRQYPAGTYWVEVRLGEKVYRRRIVKY
ncbi:M43 family zinc metalloprotease [Tellurirhabdus rosea]|uniref:M43 family zinc metalloprotease n=1 Tax=Tellurirhabdus rosea TaxID=2674997 RepID=UPI002250D97E|nr:M43 family zinc metalloprotease [Tellurirhabdus rosea]